MHLTRARTGGGHDGVGMSSPVDLEPIELQRVGDECSHVSIVRLSRQPVAEISRATAHPAFARPRTFERHLESSRVQAQSGIMGASQPIVLIVEDDEDIREALEAVALHAGFHPVSVTHGLEALTYLRSGDRLPNVILLDLMMPIMDGWQFLERRGELLRSIPVVAITAKHDATVPADVHLIHKPVSMQTLMEALRVHW
jgi:CheY-like chemotaxis protein